MLIPALNQTHNIKNDTSTSYHLNPIPHYNPIPSLQPNDPLVWFISIITTTNCTNKSIWDLWWTCGLSKLLRLDQFISAFFRIRNAGLSDFQSWN